MSMTLNERNPNVSTIPIGTNASGVTIVVPGIYFRKHSRIKNVWFLDQVGIALSSSDYQTIKLQDNSSSPVTYASVATSAAAAVVNTPLALAYTNSSDSTNNLELDVPAGTQLNVSLVGTGHAIVTKAIMLIEWYPV